MIPAALLLALALFASSDSVPFPRTVTVSAADTTKKAKVEIRPRVDLGGFISPTRGFGAGVGVGVANLGWQGSDVTLDARAQQRYQDATLVFLTADPYASRTFIRASAYGSSSSRRRFYGIGPFSEDLDRLFLNHTAADAELRVGLYAFDNTSLLIQPSARFLFDRLRGLNPTSTVGFSDLDPESRDAIVPLVGESRHALSLGVTLLSDFRDTPELPHAGTVSSVEARYISGTDGSDFSATRLAAGVAGYQPLGARTTLIGRINLTTMRSADGDGDGEPDPIPFYYLPTLDDEVIHAYPSERRLGRDALLLGAGVRQKLFEIPGYYGVEAMVIASVGQTYNDVWSEFSPSVTFERDTPIRSDGTAALQPSIGIGVGLAKLSAQRLSLSGMLGFGPSGMRLATIGVAYNLLDTRPAQR